MIPILYDKTGNTKITNLTDCIQCIVTEERNGMFEAELVYSVHSSNSDKLIRGNIIVADANDTLKEQKFRIYKVSKPINGRIKILARHISFDMARDVVTGLVIDNQSCEYALNKLFSSSQFSQHFTGHSDIVNSQSTVINGTTHILKAIVGVEGSIIDTFGTSPEILRDNYDFYIYENRGHDNGVTIEYGKNLTGLNLDTDDSNMITRIRAIAKYRDENQEEVLVVSSPEFIDSPYIDNYETPFIQEIDFSSHFKDDDTPTPIRLKTLAENYFTNNKCDLPSENATLSFIPLSKCVGYEGIQDKISLCDTVTVIDYRYNLTTKVKVIKVSYNTLKERYENMEVGEPRSRLGDIISNSMNSVKGEKGEKGEKGDKGDKGEDGSIGDFPDSLPTTPILTSSLYGFASIELSWTFESQPYYTYELYASRTENFTPNEFDLLFEGKGSTFLFQAKPNETWYFKIRCVNTHGRGTDFSNQVSVTTTKVDDLSNYVDNAAIGDALIGTLTLDRGWVGTLKGNYIDAKQLSVTDGNGKRTLFVDSFGNVSLDVTELKISSKKVATTEEVEETVSQATDNLVSNDEIPDLLTGYAKESYVDDAMENAIINAKDGMVSSTELALNNKEILLSAASMGQYNFLYNSDFRNNLDNWVPWGINEPHFGGVVDDYANSMSGENNLFIGSSNGTVGNLNLGYYQTVKLAENSSYTLSYWVNAINCTVHIIVQKVDSDNSVSNIVAKEHSNINGNKDKDTWVFDTLSFNVPEGTQEIRVVFKINNCTDPAYRGFWVKPMLVSGTKAQAWTGHPGEIYVGVVSITEKKGLVVEHSNVDTKTVMSADGFSIEDNNGDVLAWLSSKEQWTEMKVDKVFASNVENIYSGSPNLYVDHSHVGDSDGSTDKPFKSFEELRRYLSKTPIINYDLKINVMSKIDCPEMFLLENMKGTGNLGIIFDKSFIGRGLGTLEAGIKLLNIMIPVSLEAECLFDNFSHGAVISNCHLVELKGCIFNVHNYGCLFSNSKGIINEVDFANTYCAIGSERCSIVNVMSASGNGYTNGMGESCRVLTGGIIILGRGNLGAIHIPNGSYSSQGGTIITDGTCDKTNSWSYPPSTSVPSQPSNMNHTYNYNCTSKQSYQYNWSNWSTDGSCKQGAWSYGLRGGHMFFDMNKIRSEMTGTIQDGNTITLTRANSGGISGDANVYINGSNCASASGTPNYSNNTHLGTLRWGETKTFTLPKAIVQSLINGTCNSLAVYVNSTASNNYINITNASITLKTLK